MQGAGAARPSLGPGQPAAALAPPAVAARLPCPSPGALVRCWPRPLHILAAAAERSLPCPALGPAAAQAGKGEQVRVAVLGASGYTGEEVVRLLALHPTFKVTTLTGDRQAGKVGAERGRFGCRRPWGRGAQAPPACVAPAGVRVAHCTQPAASPWSCAPSCSTRRSACPLSFHNLPCRGRLPRTLHRPRAPLLPCSLFRRSSPTC